jgi:hypothetical protein
MIPIALFLPSSIPARCCFRYVFAVAIVLLCYWGECGGRESKTRRTL